MQATNESRPAAAAEPPAAPNARFVDFDDIKQGDRVVISKRFTEDDVAAFAAVSGDYNPLHMEADFARRTHLGGRVVHGMLVASYVSNLIGMQLPGAGALWMQQNFRWRHPVFLGDTLEVALEVIHKSAGSRILSIRITAMNQSKTNVMDGEGTVSVPEVRRVKTPAAMQQRVAFVSGASRGIGAALAAELARAGVSVIVNYHRNAKAAEELCHSIVTAGGAAITACADVTRGDEVARAVGLAGDAFGKPADILIHCAGGEVTLRPFLDTAWEDVQQMLDVQLKGAFNCAKAVAPGMVERQCGCIVNIGSIITWQAPPAQWSAYLMAKAALKAFTQALAAELGPSGVRVNMISPGATETGSATLASERLRKLQAMQTPLRRLASPEDIAQTALFLCSDASRFITGADVPVCGGAAM